MADFTSERHLQKSKSSEIETDNSSKTHSFSCSNRALKEGVVAVRSSRHHDDSSDADGDLIANEKKEKHKRTTSMIMDTMGRCMAITCIGNSTYQEILCMYLKRTPFLFL